MLNKIFLQGRLAADPELQHTSSGIPVVSFRIAVDRDFKSQDGNREADFINIVAWRGAAEFVSRFFAKGRMIIVAGRLQVRSYTDRDGKKRYITEVVADNLYFGDSKRSGGSGGNAAGDGGDYGPPPGGFAELSDDDGELPY